MKIQVFEPPMCCSTGLCGPSVDPVLVEFSANLDWLKLNNLEVERYNLSQQPAAFVSFSQVRNLLQTEGNDCLPIILIDGTIASRGVYPDKAVLAKLTGLDASAKVTKPSPGLKFTVQPADNTGCCASDDDNCC